MSKKNGSTSPPTDTIKDSGLLDPTFGVDGISLIPDPDDAEKALYVTRIATDPTSNTDQRLYTNGTSTRASYIIRLLKDGAIDRDFGDNGYIAIPITDPKTYALTIRNFIFTSQGKIIGWGEIYFEPLERYMVPVAVCITADGVLDTSFGDNGVAIFKLYVPKQPPTKNDHSIQNIDEYRQKRLLGVNEIQDPIPARTSKATKLADGKLLLLGTTYHASTYYHIASYLIRINSDGSLDTSFGQHGTILIEDPNHSELPDCEHFDIDRRGGIVITGTHYHTTLPALIARYDAEGHVDRSFGKNGVIHITNPNKNTCHARGIKALDDGKVIFLAAFFGGASFQNPAVIKLLPDGKMDPEFNKGEPLLVERTPAGYILSQSLSMDDGNRIIVGGKVYPEETGCISRILPVGRLDVGFGSSGTAIYERMKLVTATSSQSHANIIASGYIPSKVGYGLIRITG